MSGEVSLRVQAGRVSTSLTELEGFCFYGFVDGAYIVNIMCADRVNKGYHTAV